MKREGGCGGLPMRGFRCCCTLCVANGVFLCRIVFVFEQVRQKNRNFVHKINNFTTLKTFEELGVCEEIRRAISEMGYVSPMPVQEEVIPYLLGIGNDVIALAQTGTGKTAAFGLPVLQKINPADRSTQAVILSPTRELCLQIAEDLKDYSRYIDGLHVLAVYGGSSIETQIRALRKGAQVIVATPGRLIDLMNRGVARLDKVENVVLDEADEMLNMGFSESIDEILAGVPAERNTLLFSATMGKEIERIALNYLHNHKEIVVGSRNEGAENVNHTYYLVQAKDKYPALKRVVDYYPKIYAIIFCRTRMETQEVADLLIRDGYNAEALHGDLSQAQRDLTMQKFRQHRTQLLVATDVAARGLDVEELTHVINYGLPDDVENYTHRSGRTGRAGKRGTSISIIHIRERHKVRVIEGVIGKKFETGVLPEPKEICTKQLYRVMDEIERIEVDENEIAPFLPEVFRKLEWLSKEDVVKRIVSREFGRFLRYYADAPEIVQPSERKEKGKKNGEERGERTRGERRASGPREAEPGYKRLFINLGKRDNFYAREIINLVNRYVKGKIEIGRIDLTANCSFFEVPEADAALVMKKMAKAQVGDRRVVIDSAEREPNASVGARDKKKKGRTEVEARTDARGMKSEWKAERRKASKADRKGGKRGGRYEDADLFEKPRKKKDDWRQFFE